MLVRSAETNSLIFVVHHAEAYRSVHRDKILPVFDYWMDECRKVTEKSKMRSNGSV